MIIEEIKNIKSGKCELRNFGLIIGIALGLLSGLLWWRGKSYYTIFILFSVLFIFTGLVLPAFLKPLQKAWMTLAVVIGWFMTRVILCILFFFVFTPISLIARLSGKQFLDRRMDHPKDSYWHYREAKEFEKSNYERQF